jgi:hypothetical protein
MSHRDRALEAPDTYKYCIGHFVFRELDRVGHSITFKFDDGSELTFDIRYEVRQEAQERVA